MDYYSASALINFITSVVLGSIIFFRNPKGNINQIFCLFTFTVAFWSFFYFLWQIATSESEALTWLKILMFFAIFIPVSYLHLTLVLLEALDRYKKLLFFSYILFFVYAILDLFT